MVFPLHAITEGKCACGFESCGRIGKHPAIEWAEIEEGSAVPRPAPGAGAGIKTGARPRGSGVIVVDVDSDDALERLSLLGELPETFTVRTPRGWHVYLAHPGFTVRNSVGELAKGVDVRGDGGYVVAPGSPHASGGTYAVSSNAPPAPAPDWLLEWFKSRPAAPEIAHYSGDVSGEERERRRDLYRTYLESAPPAVEGQGGDAQLFRVVQHGAFDLALPVEDVVELVGAVYDPRCVPPWGDDLEERVIHKARDAKERSTREAAVPLPADLAHLVEGPAPPLEVLGEALARAQQAPPSGPSALGETWGHWNDPIEPPVYLLEGLIPEAKVCTFFAEGGSVKSWAAFALAISVASGETWLGRAVRQGRALILDYEDGRYEFQRRMRILRGENLDDLPDLGYLYGGPNLDRVDLWQALVPLQLRLLVIDTLGAGMPGDADENTTAFAQAVKLAGRFTEAGCTVVIVHHANKSGGMRGSSAIRDSSDVVFKFDPVSESDTAKRMRMICDKPGPQRKPAPVNLELTDAGLSTFDDEGADLARNGKGPEDLEAAIELLLARGPMTSPRLEQHTGQSRRQVLKAIQCLESEGRIRSLGLRQGFVLDSAEARTKRILAAAADYHGSIAGLAAAAHAATDEVEKLLAEGTLYKSGTGFFVP